MALDSIPQPEQADLGFESQRWIAGPIGSRLGQPNLSVECTKGSVT